MFIRIVRRSGDQSTHMNNEIESGWLYDALCETLDSTVVERVQLLTGLGDVIKEKVF